jgi:hypothetical protein
MVPAPMSSPAFKPRIRWLCWQTEQPWQGRQQARRMGPVTPL